MQCPKCEYVAAPGEARVEGQCPNCEVFYHKVRQDPQSSEQKSTPTSRANFTRRFLLAFVALCVIAVACLYGARTYSHYQLTRKVDTVLRQTNGQLAELLDEKANRTNAEFIRIYQGRLDDLDRMVASALSIDDSSVPGVTAATADYVRASREFLKRFAVELQSRLAVSSDEAAFAVASKFLDTDESKKFAALSEAEVAELYNWSTERLEQAKGVDSQIAELKRSDALEALGQ